MCIRDRESDVSMEKKAKKEASDVSMEGKESDVSVKKEEDGEEEDGGRARPRKGRSSVLVEAQPKRRLLVLLARRRVGHGAEARRPDTEHREREAVPVLASRHVAKLVPREWDVLERERGDLNVGVARHDVAAQAQRGILLRLEGERKCGESDRVHGHFASGRHVRAFAYAIIFCTNACK